MNNLNNMDLLQKVNLYRSFDAARQEDLEHFAQEFEAMKNRIGTLEADLDDERSNRRKWRQRAELAESSLGRNQFAVILIDGDGYHFNRNFYMSADESGGAQAAHALYTDIQNYLKASQTNLLEGSEYNGDVEVMAIVYFNKDVPMRVLLNADIIQAPIHFNEFMWSFTSSRSLFQTVDCGPGKERVDAKIRDLYRFYVQHAQCKHIFLACCHDSGYVAEFDKYRHDPSAKSKTILVRTGNTHSQFYNLNLPFAELTNTFEMQPIQATRRFDNTSSYVPRTVSATPSTDDNVSRSSEATPAQSSVTTWSTVTAGAARAPPRNTSFNSTYADSPSFEPTKVSKQATGDSTSGIPVNRLGQRIDRRLQAPSSAELDRFNNRIMDCKLCNNYHLASECYTYNCKYDHDPIDSAMKQVLKYKARSIPCATGSKCRKSDCFYGHQCPWARDMCTNGKCAFYRNGMHDLDDFEIAKFVPAAG